MWSQEYLKTRSPHELFGALESFRANFGAGETPNMFGRIYSPSKIFGGEEWNYLMARNVFCSIGLKLRPKLFLFPSVWCRDELSDGDWKCVVLYTRFNIAQAYLKWPTSPVLIQKPQKKKHSHNDAIFELATSLRCHECSHRCVRYVCFISVPHRFEQVCEDQDTSQCGLASCLVGLTRCWNQSLTSLQTC